MKQILRIGVALAYLVATLPVFATEVGVTLQHGFGDSASTKVMDPALQVIKSAQQSETAFLDQAYMKNQNFTSEYSSYPSTAGLTSQAQAMNNNIGGLASSSDAILAVAHSQGGLRARALLQNTYGSVTNATSVAKIKGLLTIATPHRGADVINGAPWFVGYTLGTIAGVAWTPEGGLGSFAGLALGGLALGTGIVNLVVGQGGADMGRNSSYMNALNNVPQQSCYWVSYQVQRWTLWWSWWETINEQRCQMINHPAFNPIPSSVKMLEVVGTNGDVESMLSKATGNAYSRELRWFFATTATAVAAYYTGLAFVTFGATVPHSIVWTNMSIYLWALPSLVDTMFGGPNDTLIAQEAQRLPRSGTDVTTNLASSVGGTIPFPTIYANLNHHDVVKAYDDGTRAVARFVNEIR